MRSALTDGDLPRHRLHRCQRARLDRQPEARGQADAAEHAQLVLAEACRRVADGPQHAGVQVLLAADVVDQLVFQRVEEHAVDGEVAAQGILAGRGKHHGIRVPAVAVGDIGAKRGDLDLEEALRRPGTEHLDDAEAHAHGDGAAEQPADLLGPGVGGHVVILGHPAEQFVAHAAARPQRLETGVAQAANHVDGKFTLGHRQFKVKSSKFKVKRRTRDFGLGTLGLSFTQMSSKLRP